MIRGRLKQTLLFLCVALNAIPLASAARQPYQPALPEVIAAQQAKAHDARKLLWHRRYADAQELFQGFVEAWPDDMFGHFAFMGLYQLQNFENFDDRFNRQYLEWHDEGRRRAIRILKNNKSDAWNLFLAGGALSLSAFYRMGEDQMIRGLRDAVMGIHALEKAIKKDPEFIDPLFGIGIYEYWRSVFTKRWRFLPFFPDRRERGIAHLKRVAEEGAYSRDLARGALAWIYFNERQYEESLKLNGELYRRYPKNLIIQALQGHVLSALKRYDEGLRLYRKILAVDSKISTMHFYLAKTNFMKLFDQLKRLRKEKGEDAQLPPSRYAVVIQSVEKFLEAPPNKRWEGRAYQLWGETLFIQGNDREAEEKFRMALDRHGELQHARRRLSQIKSK